MELELRVYNEQKATEEARIASFDLIPDLKEDIKVRDYASKYDNISLEKVIRSGFLLGAIYKFKGSVCLLSLW